MKYLPFTLLFATFQLPAQMPQNFEEAKIVARNLVYQDQNAIGELYCGCLFEWVGRSGGRIDADSCGYRTRARPERAARIEWEHVVPVWTLGHLRRCWKDGGREHCRRTDAVFRQMEADLHNIIPVIGEINADRSHYRYGPLLDTPYHYGSCRTRVDFKRRMVEPRDEAKGLVARVTLYMHEKYHIDLSPQQRRILEAWDRQYPPTRWEIERNRRITAVEAAAGDVHHPDKESL